MAAEVKAIDLLGSSPPIRSLKILSPPHRREHGETPDDASKEEDLLTSSYDSPSESKDRNYLKRKKKIVTFANEPEGIMDDLEDSEDENAEPASPFLALRCKRSASLPHIELNPKLNKKIKKMMDNEGEDDTLNTLLDSTLTLFEEKDKSTSELRYEYEFHGGQLLQVRIGDITEETVDVIVNEANSNLQHNNGIAGILSQVGGRDIQIQSDRWVRKYGPVPPGHVAVTDAGALQAKRVIHAVPPIWRGGNSNEDHEYWEAVWHALEASHKHRFKSVAIPAIGIGFLGFPQERAAYLLVDCVSKFWLKYPKSKVREVRFVNFDKDAAEAIVFEMVGKFTAGCETSESEKDFSESEQEQESEMSAGEPSDVDNNVDEEIETAGPKSPEKLNIIANNLEHKKYFMKSSRRQSIH